MSYYRCDYEYHLKEIKQGKTSISIEYLRFTKPKITEICEALKYNNSVIWFDMTLNDLGDSATETVADLLKFNTRIQKISLRENKIGDHGAMEIGNALKINSGLKELDLSKNLIREDGLSAIADAMKYNSSLEVLDLSYNYSIKGVGKLFEAIAENSACRLEKIVLKRVKIVKQDLDLLEKVFEKKEMCLRKLDLSECQVDHFGAAKLAEMIKMNACLSSILFGKNQILDKGMLLIGQALESNCCIEELSISGAIKEDFEGHFFSNLEDDEQDQNECVLNGLKSITDSLMINHTLKILDLSANFINDHGALQISKVLKSNFALQKLNLASNNIGDIGAQYLSGALILNNHLIDLNLSFNRIGDIGLSFLCKSLEQNKFFERLKLCSNSISEKGLEFICALLKSNPGLIYIDISKNLIFETGAESLIKALPENFTIQSLELNTKYISYTTLGRMYEFTARNRLLYDQTCKFYLCALLFCHQVTDLNLLKHEISTLIDPRNQNLNT
jgi:NLR family CARD domain-containing protein 3